ncbi:DUF4367 domain-containing protein [Acetanaerobacterium elongatum]|uniref:DUF4367 domain-containing protein n=1 Tax=Acetanaerobacterium elongatum TaxID=258515 RepID=A0A1H0G3E1_9FIRM|nr:DUF4367 domain-containing protein [Acetanaerobacterium elongatum]SDO01351.1 protein of unknown function [Acetanaerobacterium elongatum]
MRNRKQSPVEEKLKQAVTEGCLAELRALPAEAELAGRYSFSQGFLERMERLIKRHRRSESVRKAVRGIGKTAAGLIIVTALLFGMLVAVSPSIRAAVASFITEWYSDHLAVYFRSNPEAEDRYIWRPQYLPKGYAEREEKRAGHIANVFYQDKAGNELVFTYIPRTGSFTVGADNEGKTQKDIKINGNKAILLETVTKDERSSILWETEEAGFEISGVLNTNELIKMAESVKCFNK